MIEISLPGRDLGLKLQYLMLDVNGTLTVDGQLIPGVKERIELLKEHLEIYLLTADTFGKGAQVAAELGANFKRVNADEGGFDKRDFLLNLGQKNVATIGNGYNDIYMLKEAALGIAVIGKEGCSVEAIKSSDIVVNDINDALDLLLYPKRIVATLRA